MTPKFDEKKTTQLAGLLLKLREQDGRMSYMKLIKLMYLIDREALLRWGWSMTGDTYASMKHGQVLSNTYDLIKEEILGRSYWRTFISAPFGDKEIKLLKEPETDELSKADHKLVAQVYKKFGHWNRWDLADFTHGLPEYRETTGSLPVGYAEVLKKVKNIPDEKVEAVLNELHSLALLERLG